MRLIPVLAFALLLANHQALSSNACSDRSIITAADVTVSDASSFKTESYYHSRNNSAIRHLDDQDRWVVVEGPIGWARTDDKAQIGSDFMKLFALGHQYHALLLEFDQIANNVQQNVEVEFAGGTHRALTGDYPFGGIVHLVQSEIEGQPLGLRFDFPGDTLITSEFLDWRMQDGQSLPFHIRINDGERTFDYRYTSVDISSESPLWFFEAVSSPGIDEIDVYRLHRKLLAAHCLGDADMMAALSAESVLSANRGELAGSTNEELRTRFTSLFGILDYTEYHDLLEPTIEVSGDVGWIGVNTRAVGNAVESQQTFDDQWAWIMTVRKVDGQWLHTGNASNRLPQN